MQAQSCLVARLERLIALTQREREFIARMERDEVSHAAGDVILEPGRDMPDLFVLKYGWVVVRSRPHEGRSQILRIYLPGELIGLAELSLKNAMHRLVMQTDGVLCPFPKSQVTEMYQRVPRLAALLMAISSRDQIALRQRVFSLSRLNAEDRMIDFLLTLHDRLSVQPVARNARVMVPFTQAELGDVLRLTQVYVSQVLKRLKVNGRIEIERPYVRLLDLQGMRRQVGFESEMRQLDVSWFPAADECSDHAYRQPA